MNLATIHYSTIFSTTQILLIRDSDSPAKNQAKCLALHKFIRHPYKKTLFGESNI